MDDSTNSAEPKKKKSRDEAVAVAKTFAETVSVPAPKGKKQPKAPQPPRPKTGPVAPSTTAPAVPGTRWADECPPPPLEPQASASRTLSPVSQGFRRSYGRKASRIVSNLEFQRKIPVLREDNFQEIQQEVADRKRYRTKVLSDYAATCTAVYTWEEAYLRLTAVWQPSRALLVDNITQQHYEVKDCIRWKTLPSTIATTDEAFWRSLGNQITKIDLRGNKGSDAME